MNEDEMRRIREQQERLDERRREKRQENRRDVFSNAERDAAIATATQTALLGSVPSIIWYLISVFNSGAFVRALFSLSLFVLVLSSLWLIVPWLIMLGAVGVVSGLFAHWWFHGTVVSVRRMAIVLALLADAALFGWVLVLTR